MPAMMVCWFPSRSLGTSKPARGALFGRWPGSESGQQSPKAAEQFSFAGFKFNIPQMFGKRL